MCVCVCAIFHLLASYQLPSSSECVKIVQSCETTFVSRVAQSDL